MQFEGIVSATEHELPRIRFNADEGQYLQSLTLRRKGLIPIGGSATETEIEHDDAEPLERAASEGNWDGALSIIRKYVRTKLLQEGRAELPHLPGSVHEMLGKTYIDVGTRRKRLVPVNGLLYEMPKNNQN